MRGKNKIRGNGKQGNRGNTPGKAKGDIRGKNKRRGKGDAVGALICYGVMGAFAAAAIIPFLHVLAKSVSSAAAVMGGRVWLWPSGFQAETVGFIVRETQYLRALGNTVAVTAAGTAISMAVTALTAYPLSKPDLKGRKLILLLYVFSMLFYGGMIPAYMVMKALRLLDTLAALIVPFVIIQFNMLIVKNYFEQLPPGVEESAKLDGAGSLRILVSIVCPISKPVIATISLFYAVSYWNNYFHALLYLSSPSRQTLQLFLYSITYSAEGVMEQFMSGEMANISAEGIRSAVVVLTILPILFAYPFIQRYFVQGITIGSEKG